MDGLGLAEPVAVTLVRRGYRTVEAARAFLEAADDHDPFLFEAMAEVCDRLHVAITHGPPDHGPRRLRRRRRLLDRDPGARAPGAGRRLRLADPRPARGRLRADRGHRRAAGRARHRAAADRRLRDRLGRRGRSGARRRDRGDRHRPPPAGRRAARRARSCTRRLGLPVRRALRDRGRLQARGGAARPSARPRPTSTWSRWRRSPTSYRCVARTGRSSGADSRSRGAPGARASARCWRPPRVAPERLDEGDFAFRLGPRINAAGPALPRRRRASS